MSSADTRFRATRRQYAADAPLIGVAAWHVLDGNEKIEQHVKKENPPGDALLAYQKEVLDKGEKKKPSIELDPGHSHFFLIKGPKKNFGDEIPSRSAFESQVSHGRDDSKKIHTETRLAQVANYDKWKENREKSLIPPQPSKSNSDKTQQTQQMISPASKHAVDQDANTKVPVVLVCVQGGPGTVSTVLTAARQGTPVLIVKGSGKAADLIAGAFPALSDLESGHLCHPKAHRHTVAQNVY
eukprot:2660313-Rhodomonas_salina.1